MRVLMVIVIGLVAFSSIVRGSSLATWIYERKRGLRHEQFNRPNNRVILPRWQPNRNI